MNCKNYKAYVMNKKKQEEKTLVIEVENLQEIKLLLATKQFNVEGIDKLIFANTEGKILATFDVHEIVLL